MPQRARARAHQELKRAEQCDREAHDASEAAQLRGPIERRLAANEEAHAELGAAVATLAQATGEAIGNLCGRDDELNELLREQREEIRELKIEVAKLASTVAELLVRTVSKASSGSHAKKPTKRKRCPNFFRIGN